MSGDTANPRIWTNADFFGGPLGTTAPTDVATGLDAAYNNIGLMDEDTGIEEIVGRSTKDHYAYGGIRYRKTANQQTYQLTVMALEDSQFVYDLRFPDADQATTAGVTTRSVTVWKPKPRAFVLHTVDDTSIRRLVIPRGDIVEPPGTISVKDDTATMWKLIIDVYADGDGVWGYDITNNPASVVA